MSENVLTTFSWKNSNSWIVLFLYLLLIFSTFSISGIVFASIGLISFSLYRFSRSKNIDKLPKWIVAPFILWLGSAILSALVNPEILRTLDNMRGEYRLLLPFAMVPALLLIDIRKLLKVFLFFVVLMAIYGVIQYFYGVDWFRSGDDKLITPFKRDIAGKTSVFHAKGNFSHHLTYAGFMLINAPLFFSLFIHDLKRTRWLWAGASVLTLLAVFVSLGRSGWVGVFFGFGILILMLPRKWAFPLIFVGVFTFTLFVSLMTSGWLQETFSHPDNPDFIKRILSTNLSRDKDRLYLWQAGGLGIQDNPILGVGIGNEDYYFEPYRQIVSKLHGGHTFFTKASAGVHNMYLQVGYTMGAIGLAVHLWLFGSVFYWCILWIRKAGKDFSFERGLLWGAIGGLFGNMIAAIFENNFFDGEVQTMVMIIIGLALYAGMMIRQQARNITTNGG